MAPKLQLAVFFLATLVPFWLMLVAADMTRKVITVFVAVLVAATVCYFENGLQGAIAVIGAAYGGFALLEVGKALARKIQRRRLVDNSRPEQVDLERWARKVLRKQAWVVQVKSGPVRLVARRDGYTEFHIFCAAAHEVIGPSDIRNLARYASQTRVPVVLLLFGGAPPNLVETLRARKILPVGQRDFLRHVALARSRDVFVNSCRAAVIQDYTRALPTYNALSAT